MTIWKPDLDEHGGPAYRGIAEAIARGIERGTLAPGERLPTQRELAGALGIAVTTVTRGYAEAERRGLVSGEVGRGTFVRAWDADEQRSDRAGVIDLHANSMPAYPHATELIERLGTILLRADRSVLLDYQPHRGTERQRRAGAVWLERAGVPAHVDQVLVTSGVQHAMAVVFSTLTKPGDTVLVEELTYGGMKCVANLLHLTLKGLPIDEEGLRPDAFRAACAEGDARALYCMPSLQNPTAVLMSEARRKEIAAIAAEFDLPIVEDDSYGFLVPDVAPLSAHAPGAYYLNGVSKSLAAALRVGFVRAPVPMVDRLEAAIASTAYMASGVLAEVVAEWIHDRTADRVAAWKRGEVQRRQAIARRVLGAVGYRAHPQAQHGWLQLPEPWTTHDFVSQAAMRGVVVSPADDFVVGRGPPCHAVRLAVGPPLTHRALEQGLATLAEILSEPPEPRAAVV